jgi:hypothetical protein
MNKNLPLSPIEKDALLYLIISVLILISVNQLFASPLLIGNNTNYVYASTFSADKSPGIARLGGAQETRNILSHATNQKEVPSSQWRGNYVEVGGNLSFHENIGTNQVSLCGYDNPVIGNKELCHMDENALADIFSTVLFDNTTCLLKVCTA